MDHLRENSNETTPGVDNIGLNQKSANMNNSIYSNAQLNALNDRKSEETTNTESIVVSFRKLASPDDHSTRVKMSTIVPKIQTPFNANTHRL